MEKFRPFRRPLKPCAFIRFIRQSALVIFFLLVLIAFQVGALDLPGMEAAADDPPEREEIKETV
jgi:hypothetical protein